MRPRLLACVLIGITAPAFAEPPKSPTPFPDLSDPKAAAFSLAIALEQGDVKTAREIYIGKEEVFQSFLQEVAIAQASIDRLHKAMIARFGKSGQAVSPSMNMKLDFGESVNLPLPTLVAFAKVKQTGDEAVLSYETNMAGWQARVKKVGGEWKVTEFIIPPLTIVLLKVAAAACEQVAKEVEAGKYAKAYDVLPVYTQVLAKKIQEQMKKIFGNGVKPKKGEPKMPCDE